jgi:hypothetical protein
MANTNFQQLPVAVGLTGGEIIPILQSGTDKRTTVQDVANTFANNFPASVEYVLDDGGVTITTGNKGYLQLPFSGTFTAVALLGNTTGSVVIDLWKCTYTAFDGGITTPSAANSIVGGDYPTISSGTKYQLTNLSPWTVTSFTTNDILAFVVNSCSSFTRITISLQCTRSGT